jgi:hypothetical protein
MATKEQIEIAVSVIREIANDPSVGAVKELIDLLEASASPAIEVRVVEPKEKR